MSVDNVFLKILLDVDTRKFLLLGQFLDASQFKRYSFSDVFGLDLNVCVFLDCRKFFNSDLDTGVNVDLVLRGLDVE